MHKYKLGQTLDLLPYEGHTVQYKVQSKMETHQRIVAETDLRLPHTV